MWLYNNQVLDTVPDGMEGFVYLIENLTNNRKYIGKKTFWERRKDQKTGRRKKKESNWQSYCGSCDELIEDYKQLGSVNFKKTILYLCPHKKSMSYFETLEQFKRDVIMREDYYNTNVEGKFFSSEKENIYEKVIVSESVQQHQLLD
jgi:thiol-disulfide isomerase/thioredoxin